jgi:uncharacterized protein with HEPN domain
MRPETTDLKYIWDMLDAARTAVELVQGKTLEEYERMKPLRFAVERAIEIIGEAARNVSEAFRGEHPTIQWSAIVATRHILSHEYADIQHDKIWRIATIHVPVLILQLEPIIEAHPPSSSQEVANPPEDP